MASEERKKTQLKVYSVMQSVLFSQMADAKPIAENEKRILFVKNKSDHVDFGAASSFVAPKKDQPGFAVRYLNDVTEEPIYSVPSRPKPCIAESGETCGVLVSTCNHPLKLQLEDGSLCEDADERLLYGFVFKNKSYLCDNYYDVKIRVKVTKNFKNDKQYITEVLGIKSQSRSKINGVNYLRVRVLVPDHEEKTDLQNGKDTFVGIETEEIINDSSVLQNNAEMLREIEEKDGPASTKCDDSDNSCERDYGYYSQFHNDDDLNRRIMASTLWKAIDKAKMTQYVTVVPRSDEAANEWKIQSALEERRKYEESDLYLDDIDAGTLPIDKLAKVGWFCGL